MSTARISELAEKQKTHNSQGVRFSTYATDYIYQGKCFSCSQRLSVGGSSSLIVLFNMVPAYALGRQISVYTPVFDANNGPITVDYYAGSDYTGGTVMTINNRAYYGELPGCTLTYGATGSSKGTKFSEGYVVAGHKSSGSSQEGLEFVPSQNTNILVELTNTDGSAAIIYVSFVWFEV